MLNFEPPSLSCVRSAEFYLAYSVIVALPLRLSKLR